MRLTAVAVAVIRSITSLDHLWHDFLITSKIFVISPSLADYYVVSLAFGKNKILDKLIVTRFWDFSSLNHERFLSSIEWECLSFITTSYDINLYTSYF